MRFWVASSVFLSLLAAPAWCGGTLTTGQQNTVTSWLRQHANYRLATDADCNCPIDIEQMRDGYGDARYALPDYHPFTATGDFNDDGIEDFAVALIDRKVADNFTLVVFNGPSSDQPAFIRPSLDLRSDRLFYFGSLRSKPYRLWVGPFNSDAGFKLTPSGNTYRTASLVE
ncbi:MAG: hypothetical protein LAP61_16640 [Acidobacteriia bacterium]|nr:hypothetical protein [Terriglobia bacterium]